MSFLSPLFLAGLTALALPVVFHMFRRSPQGRQVFSSLMFLPVSPPRLTRRSSIEHWLLLVLRALALALIAFAFARPLLRENVLATENASARQIAILMDTSASMRRSDCWTAARNQLDEILDDVEEGDEIALFHFSDRLTVQEPFPDVGQRETRSQVQQRIRQGAENLAPGWGATRLGDSLIQLAEDLLQRGSGDEYPTASRIVVITDSQKGMQLDALKSYVWPDSVPVEFRVVGPEVSKTGNAFVQVLQPSPDDDGTTWRIRVGNETGSAFERFRIHWEPGQIPEDPVLLDEVYVPPGEVRTLKIDKPDKLVAGAVALSGDTDDFDNRWYIVPPQPDTLHVGYIGPDPGSPQSPGYYLKNALVETTWTRFEFHALDPSRPEDWKQNLGCLLIAGNGPVPEADRVRELLRQGVVVCWVFEQESETELASLLEIPELKIEPVEIVDYALLSRVDFQHPLFSSFADPRFNDFTAVRFREARRLNTGLDESLVELARFDEGSPAVLVREFDPGLLVLMASGWHPSDSRFGLSTKFVPFIHSVIRLGQQKERGFTSSIVNLPLDLDPGMTTVQAPSGSVIPVEPGETTSVPEPGLYTVVGNDAISCAVNMDPRESRTDVIPVEEIEQLGVSLTSQQERDADDNRDRQLRIQELEAEQKIWRWLLIAAVFILFLESFLAGRMTRPIPVEGTS